MCQTHRCREALGIKKLSCTKLQNDKAPRVLRALGDTSRLRQARTRHSSQRPKVPLPEHLPCFSIRVRVRGPAHAIQTYMPRALTCRVHPQKQIEESPAKCSRDPGATGRAKALVLLHATALGPTNPRFFFHSHEYSTRCTRIGFRSLRAPSSLTATDWLPVRFFLLSGHNREHPEKLTASRSIFIFFHRQDQAMHAPRMCMHTHMSRASMLMNLHAFCWTFFLFSVFFSFILSTFKPLYFSTFRLSFPFELPGGSVFSVPSLETSPHHQRPICGPPCRSFFFSRPCVFASMLSPHVALLTDCSSFVRRDGDFRASRDSQELCALSPPFLQIFLPPRTNSSRTREGD